MLCAGHPAAASQGSATVLKGVQSNQKKLAHVWSQQDSASMHRQACIVCHAEMRFPLTQEAMLQLRLLGLVLLHNAHAHRGAHLLAATSASALLPCTQQSPGLPLRAAVTLDAVQCLQVDPSTILLRGLRVRMGIATGMSEGTKVLRCPVVGPCWEGFALVHTAP